MSKKIETLLEFEDNWNPVQFHCRLIDIGVPKRKAKTYSERYETEIYRPLMKELKNERNK